MKTKELRELSDKNINELINKGRKDLRKARFERASGGLKNLLKIRSLRREIARALTVLKEKERKHG